MCEVRMVWGGHRRDPMGMNLWTIEEAENRLDVRWKA